MFRLFLTFLGLLHACRGLLEDAIVSFSHSSDAVPIHGATIIYSHDEAAGVGIATDSLAGDWEAITGNRPDVWQYGSDEPSSPQGHAIIVSTLDSDLMVEICRNVGVDLSVLEGKWEAFTTSLVYNALPGLDSSLLILGSDSRGATFGVHTLAEQSGQSPYHYWLDVPAKKHDEIYALPTETYSGEPAVKYRGLFINDEAPTLTTWWSRKFGEDPETVPLNTEFYRHVFDLLLRLKANFIWPAMWGSFVPEPGRRFFTDDPENQSMADDFGIVVSTSHHEPMQRATNEWNATEMGLWDWTVNKENVTAFMREGIERAKGNESYYTLGMRGPNDGPIAGDEEQEPIDILREVFDVQRDILNEVLGNDTKINKVWTIYKEVFQYYAGGLVPDDDVTLMFANDNFGNMLRLPLANETARSGGVGMYFHLQYYGRPHHYKWYNSNNLPKIHKELYQAMERNVDQIWVMNVGEIKPMEFPFGFIMDYAWNPSRITPESIPQYVEHFTTREFGPDYATEIAEILFEHSRLVGRRNLESIVASTYSTLNYNESQRVLGEWEALGIRTLALEETLPEEHKSPFFHLCTYPVMSGLNYHQVVLGQGQNYQYSREQRNQANYLAYDLIENFEESYDWEQRYNELENGKWDGLSSQRKFEPNAVWIDTSRDVLNNLTFVQLRQNGDYQWGPVGIYVEGSDSAAETVFRVPSLDESAPTDRWWAPVLPTFTRYGAESHFVEMFHRGDHRVPHNWTISNDNDWLHLSLMSGQVSREDPQQTVHFSVDWDRVPTDFNDTIRVRADWDAVPYWDYISIPVFGAAVPEDFHGFPEANGVVSIEPAHHQRQSSGNISFATIPYLGSRTDSGTLALRPYTPAREDSFEPDSAWVEYDFYLFEESREGVNATIYLTSGLDTDPTLPMRFKLTVDGQDGEYIRMLEDPEISGDVPPSWTTEIENNIWTRNVTLGNLSEGSHTLRWNVNSPEVYLEKLVLSARGEVPDSYLGPPESMLL
ncbi:hypothetical protein MBLNU230_g1538t1 [Neophaeotheca triangularis]